MYEAAVIICHRAPGGGNINRFMICNQWCCRPCHHPGPGYGLEIYWSQHITNNSCLTGKIMISTKFRLRYHFDNRPSFYSNKRHKTKPFIGFSPTRGRFGEKSSHFCCVGEKEMEYDIIITFYSS